MMFAQTLALQNEVIPHMRGVKDPNEAWKIFKEAFREAKDKEKWAAFGITNDKFVNLTVELMKVLVLQTLAENAMSELKSRIYGLLSKEMRAYLFNLSSCYKDYMKGRERFGKENTNGIIDQTDLISSQFEPYIIEFKKAILGQVLYQKLKHTDLMVYAILAEKLAAVACQFTTGLINNKLYDFPPNVQREISNIDFHNMAKMLRTIRRKLEEYCGQVDFSHAIKMNMAFKRLITKIDNIKREENGKYITV